MAHVALAAAAGVLTACAPIPQVVDTPKTGDSVALSVKQPMQVRWSNANPTTGAWTVETPPGASAVALVKHTQQPPQGGAMGLDVFDFVGARKGVERLTFAYQHKDGRPADADERITIEVTVG
jgi:predicted secreted protein